MGCRASKGDAKARTALLHNAEANHHTTGDVHEVDAEAAGKATAQRENLYNNLDIQATVQTTTKAQAHGARITVTEQMDMAQHVDEELAAETLRMKMDTGDLKNLASRPMRRRLETWKKCEFAGVNPGERGEFTISVPRGSPREPLGIRVQLTDPEALPVEVVYVSGAIPEWNRRHVVEPSHQVCVGDIIMSVNGFSDPGKMREELRTADKLDLTIKRDWILSDQIIRGDMAAENVEFNAEMKGRFDDSTTMLIADETDPKKASESCSIACSICY
eukprot:TRINITY_DN20864_c0_g1_i1.p1 TRINITY_DN20864_c0_g1~~TRINITY_DN20864_c0_g1_i1.p1  ORF type:complete len:275 (+),score=50.62 TRINITY_DN20864_c0_g1_i1:94-918(+)